MMEARMHLSRLAGIIFFCLAFMSNSADAQMSTTSRALTKSLQTQIDLKDFALPMSFIESVALLNEKLTLQGVEARILVDVFAFKEDCGIAQIYDQPVHLPNIRRATAAHVLQMAMVQAADGKGAVVIRKGVVELTTTKRASIRYLLGQKITWACEKLTFAEAIDEISDMSGVSVVIDPRIAADKLKMPITLSFRSDVTPDVALRLAAEMADLKLAVLGSAVYLTTAANAERMLQEEGRLGIQPTPPSQAGKRVPGVSVDPFSG